MTSPHHGAKQSPSLATRLTMALTIAVTVVTLVAGGGLYLSTINESWNEIRDKGTAAIAYLNSVLGLPLWNFDDAVVANIGRTLMEDGSYAALVISDSSGRVVFSQERETRFPAFPQSSIIRYRGTMVGHIQLTMTAGAVRQQTREILYANFIILALVLATITVCTVFLIRFLFQRPIGQLRDIAESYGAGNFEAPGGQVRYLEFQPLLDALARMGERITSQIAALREREERYRELVEDANSIILRWKPDGAITFLNPFGLAFFGFRPGEIIGRNVVGTIVPERESTTGRDLAALMEELRKNPDRYRNNENENMRKNGDRVWVAWTNRAIVDDRGAVGEILSIGNDLTEKKALEDQLMQAQKMEAIGTLAGGVAHDFNNLLMAIEGNASLLGLDMDPADPRRERLKNIQEQVESAANLTRQLLGFARGGTYDVRTVDMNDVTDKTATVFMRTRRDIAVHRRYAGNLWTVRADRGQMEQVLMNLYLNAAHAMPAGGELHLETDNAVLPEEAARAFMAAPGPYVRITVTDTGTGMDEQTRQRIFDPFFTTKEMGHGTGLGLATVYGIVKAHGGFIRVTSERGRGSAFTVHLPASPTAVIAPEEPTEEVVPGRGTILLVDDEANILDVTGEMLDSLGYRVLAAGSGEEALEVFRGKSAEIDLVILDMIMPGLSGGEVFDRLREVRAGVPVLLSSGYSMVGPAREILAKGCRGFLQKPYSMSQLSQKVKSVMGCGEDGAAGRPEPPTGGGS